MRQQSGGGEAAATPPAVVPPLLPRARLWPPPQAAHSCAPSHRLRAAMKSPFDVEDAKLDASSPSGGPTVIDLEARPSALGSGLSQRLSALGQNLSHRISHLSHQMDEHGLTRISAVKVMADDKDTVTEPGRGALHLLLCMVAFCLGYYQA